MTKPKNPQIGDLFEDWLKDRCAQREGSSPTIFLS